jgi:ATP-dependent helicase HepA
VRAAYTFNVELSPAEQAFYDGVLKLVRRELRTAGQGAPAFAVIAKERMAASCLAATREVFEEAARARAAAWLEVDHSAFDLEASDTEPTVVAIEELVALSREIGEADAKFDLFERTLQQVLSESTESKALVFSFFRRTLRYLHRRLRKLGYNVGVIHGEIPIPERQRIIDQFRADREMRVLLSSEVGAEGLDFEFCDVLVNYDLPWNPMQLEQRIGRLDRFGQEHDRIRIYNFCIQNTVETRIFQRLYDRIAIFQQSIGDLEAILGEEIRELSRAVLQADLTPEEQERLADEAAARIVRRQLEADALEREKDQFLGQEEMFSQQVEETVKSGRVVTAAELRALVATWLQVHFRRSRLEDDRELPCALFQPDAECASYIRQHLAATRRETTLTPRFNKALNDLTTVPLTFDSDYARQHPNSEFITARHPLASAAAAYWRERHLAGIPATGVAIRGPATDVGEGYFFLYLLDVRGTSQEQRLHPVIVLDNGRLAPGSAETLLSQLATAPPPVHEASRSVDGFPEAERVAAAWIASHRDAVQQEEARRHEALVAARSASVRASFDAKVARVSALLEETGDNRIRRMREAQLTNLRARLDAKLAQLEATRGVHVSYQLVAGGWVRIVDADTPAHSAPSSFLRPKLGADRGR